MTDHGSLTDPASAAKYAARTLANTLKANSNTVRPEDAVLLGTELRDILISVTESLRVIEFRAPDQDASNDAYIARRSTEEAGAVLGHRYLSRSTDSAPPSQDEFTRITEPGEIETLTHGRELVVSGTVYRVCHSEGKVIVGDLTGTQYWQPEVFIERFRQSRFGILLRH